MVSLSQLAGLLQSLSTKFGTKSHIYKTDVISLRIEENFMHHFYSPVPCTVVHILFEDKTVETYDIKGNYIVTKFETSKDLGFDLAKDLYP